jgi:hypothetical protein
VVDERIAKEMEKALFEDQGRVNEEKVESVPT